MSESKHVQVIIDLCALTASESRRVRRVHRRQTADQHLLSQLTPILRAWLTDDQSESAAADEQLVLKLAQYFHHEIDLLPATIRTSVDLCPGKVATFAHSLFDLPKIDKFLLEQCLGLKFGGNISDKRWKEIFSPMFTQQVMFISHLCEFWVVQHHMCLCVSEKNVAQSGDCSNWIG